VSVPMKDSGIAWLGEVPAHWGVVQSRRLFIERNEKARQNDQQLTVSQKYGLLPQKQFMKLEGRRIVVVQKGQDILKRTMPGDFVISMRSFQGGLELSELEGAVSSAYVPITPIKWVVLRYFRWLFKSNTYIQALQATSDLVRDGQALRFENFAKVPLPIVPEAEQVDIANFVDRSTSRVDRLIAKKTRFIDLLREKREALVTHVVTKGVDAGVPMKDSGIEWLGKVPAHWDVVPATILFSESKERARDGDQMLSATQKYGVIPLADFEEMEQRQVTKANVNLEMRKHVEVGDFVISMRSMDGGLERARAAGSVRSSYSVLKPGPDVEGRYFGALLKCSLYIQALRLTSNFIRDGQDLSFTHVRKVKLPRPRLDEQAAIADYLDHATARLDTLIAKTERSIELLREHRIALITAAVTGKLELRNGAQEQ
jgi:type I restriction enzyme S subunit